VFISSLTDPYQPVEKKYGLTRKILEILLRHQFPIIVQTKSSLILRDFHLLSKFKDCEVGFTITTLDDDVKKNFEPHSSPVKERLEALKILKENKIKTYVFVGPILPHLTDKDLKKLIKIASELKVDCLWFDKLNLKVGTWDNVKKILQGFYPELMPIWEETFFHKNSYYSDLKKIIAKTCKENNINYRFCY